MFYQVRLENLWRTFSYAIGKSALLHKKHLLKRVEKRKQEMAWDPYQAVHERRKNGKETFYI